MEFVGKTISPTLMEFVGKAISTNLNGIRGQGHFGPTLPLGLYHLPFFGFKAMTNYSCVTNFWLLRNSCRRLINFVMIVIRMLSRPLSPEPLDPDPKL